MAYIIRSYHSEKVVSLCRGRNTYLVNDGYGFKAYVEYVKQLSGFDAQRAFCRCRFACNNDYKRQDQAVNTLSYKGLRHNTFDRLAGHVFILRFSVCRHGENGGIASLYNKLSLADNERCIRLHHFEGSGDRA